MFLLITQTIYTKFFDNLPPYKQVEQKHTIDGHNAIVNYSVISQQAENVFHFAP